MHDPSARNGRSALLPLIGSAVLHVSMLGVGATALVARAGSSPGPASEIEIGLHTDVVEADARTIPEPGSLVVRPEAQPVPSRRTRSGEVALHRPDTRSAGRGGAEKATQSAAHLSDSIDGLTLDTDPTLLTPESQISRLATDSERRSREDRRTTPNPMELTFVATGPGHRFERRPAAVEDPSRGSFGAVPLAVGSRPRPPTNDAPSALRIQPAPPVTLGAAETPPGGAPDGSRPDMHRRSAAIAVARPAIRQGRASISTTTKGRPADTVDSSLAVASLVQSLVSASSAGGLRGEGPGGAEGEGAPGAEGASRSGMLSRASGEGGRDDGAETSGISGYAASVTRKVYPYWEEAFPTWARVEGRGGVAVIGVTLDHDGRIRDIRIVRGSGFPEFDANVARALEQASPYGRLPPAVQRTGLTLHIAFDAMNPAVGRNGPGAGRR